MKHVSLIRNIVAVLVAGTIGSASVQAVTWDGGGDNTSWGDANNWDPNGVPVANVDDVTITNATAAVNLGATTRSLQGRTVVFADSTLTNGTLSFTEASGSLAATNVTFASNALFNNSVPRNMTLVNSTYSGSGQTWSFGNNFNSGGLTIKGGTISGIANLITRPVAGSTVTTLLIDGSVGFHTFDTTSFGNNGSTLGLSEVTFQNASVRITSGGDWGGGGVGSVTRVNLTNATVRLDDGIVLRDNLTLNTKNSTFLLNSSGSGEGVRGLRNLLTSATKFDGEGLTIDATTENNLHPFLEVAGRVPVGGVTLSQFHDNYSVDHLILGAVSGHTRPKLYLKDTVDNDGVAGAEALFTDKITYSTSLGGNTFTNDTGGFNIYYKKLITNGKTVVFTGGGSLIQVTGAKLVSTAPYTWKDGGDAEVAIFGGPTLTLANPSDYGTVIITNAPTGGDLFLRLDVTGSAGDISALAGEIGASVVDGDLVFDYSGLADGNNQFFDWSFAYASHNVTVTSIFATIPEPSAMLLVVLAGATFLRRTRQS